MPFVGLVIHSLSIVATFKYQVLIRSTFMILAFGFLFTMKSNTILVIVSILIALFCATIFVISSRENIEELNNSQNKIENITNIHSLKL